MMRKLRTLTLILVLCGLAEFPVRGQEGQPSAADRQRTQAAEAFAKALASEGSEEFAQAFRLALGAAYQVEVAEGSGSGRALEPIPNRGGIESDPRYQQNLDSARREQSGKIWGGRRVTPGAFPDIVAILGGGSLCSGTLIAPNVVLTAAHCHCGNVNETVVLGSDINSPTAQTIRVTRSESQISCDRPLREGDLALLFLESNVQVSPRRFAPSEWIDNATSVHLVGFGKTEDPFGEPYGIKREVNVVVASPGCSGTVSTPLGRIPDSTFYDCGEGRELVAGKPALDRDSCDGDSGGPAFVRGPDGQLYLAAATSRPVVRPDLRPCGDGGIYARADGSALAWIQSKGVSVGIGQQAAAPARSLQLTTSETGSLASATLAPMQLLAISGPRVNQLLSDEIAEVQSFLKTHSKKAITGTIQQQPDGSLSLSPSSRPAISLPISNSAEISSAVAGLPVTVRLEGQTPETIRIRGLTLEALEKWTNNSRALPRRSFQSVHQAVEDLRVAADEALRPDNPDSKRAQETILVRSEQTEREIINRYASLPPQETEKRLALVRQYREVRKISKAIYGRLDVYRPEAYRRIFENSRGTVAVSGEDDPEPFCSGVLIGKDLVLTALHCLNRHAPDELEVRFNYEIDLAGSFLSLDRYPVEGIIAQGASAFDPDGPELDFALLFLGKNESDKSAGESWPAQCLSLKRVRRNDSLYVIGHPQGYPRVVHDNAFVFFPFQVTRFEFNELKILVESEFLDDPQRNQRLAEFTGSYRERVLPPPAGYSVFENFSHRWGLQPTIGADSDTYHGNSGSAVFSRTNHLVVGLLFAGEDDLDTPWSPGWRAHEAILPTSQIVEQLDRSRPDWRTLEGVCVR